MPETTEPLTEAQIEAIAARKAHQYGTMVSLPVAERDALIRDRRAMKAENERQREQYKDLDADYADEVKENAALREQLAEAEKEVRGVLIMLGKDAIHSRPDGAAEDIYESLAISVTKLKSELARTKQHRDDLIKELNRERGIK